MIAEPAPRPLRLGRRAWAPYLLLLPGLAWLAIFYIIPTFQLLGVSLQTGTLETGFRLAWRWQTYPEALASWGVHFVRSVSYAGLATVLALLISYPLAYFIAFRAGRYKNLMLVLVLMPFLTPFLLRTLAWKVILSDDGLIVRVLQGIGLVPPGGRLLATGAAVVAGITYNFLPFMTLPVYVSLEKVDRSLIEAANDLYANPLVAFRRVTWPLSLPGVVAGTLLTMIPAAGDYVNARLLGTPQQFMVGNVIQSRFLVVLDYPSAAALSFILMAVILTVVLLYVRAAGTEELVG